jgi:ceramide glucosyltransferase
MIFFQGVFFVLSLAAIFYYCFAIYAAISFFTPPPCVTEDFQPPVTILKPLSGVEWESYQNLASFCGLNYPDYQIIFSTLNPQDPCLALVKQLQADFPHLDLDLVVSDRTIGTNLKVSNLANGVSLAKHDFLVIADSDIRVEKDYLTRVIQPLKNPQVGVVTCLYNSLTKGWLAGFEALEISTQFAARVLTALKLEGIKYAFGSTIVIRKKVLETMGGFEAIADYLADDYQLGNLPAKKGYQVILSDYVVSHTLADVGWQEFINRQTRWAKCIKVGRFWGYLGLIFTQGTVSSLMLLIISQASSFSQGVLIITWIFRFLMAWIVGVKSLQDTVAKSFIFWLPLRDIISLAIWCYGLVGNQVEWRGQKFKLIDAGKLAIIK